MKYVILLSLTLLSCQDKVMEPEPPPPPPPYECDYWCGEVNWFCNPETKLCECLPGAEWCVTHKGARFLLKCSEKGDYAVGNRCWQECVDGPDHSYCWYPED